MPSIDVSGTPHFYELTSPAANPQLPVLVFVHGWLLSHRYWQPLIEILESDYQCLVYDLRGFGGSQLTSDSVNTHYNLASFAQDLSYLLKKLEIENAWLVGHSLGGNIALWTASLCPQVVRGVIAVNSGGGIYLKEEFERFRTVGQHLVRFRPSWLLNVPGLDYIFARMMVYRPLSVDWGRQRIIDFIGANQEAALGSLLESTTEQEVHHLPQLVSRLQQPVYFIAGEKDKVIETRYVRHLASFHQLFDSHDSNVVEIADCGHLAIIENPQTVAEIAIAILQQHGVVCNS